MFQADLLLNGQARAASNGATFERRNPATGEVATRAAAATLDDVDAAVQPRRRPSRPGRPWRRARAARCC